MELEYKDGVTGSGHEGSGQDVKSGESKSSGSKTLEGGLDDEMTKEKAEAGVEDGGGKFTTERI